MCYAVDTSWLNQSIVLLMLSNLPKKAHEFARYFIEGVSAVLCHSGADGGCQAGFKPAQGTTNQGKQQCITNGVGLAESGPAYAAD